MNNDYTYTPGQTGRTQWLIAGLLYVAAIGLYGLGATFKNVRLFLHVGTMAAAVAALQITIRWCLSTHYYTLTAPDEESPSGSLVISRLQGERRRIMASLSLETAIAMEPAADRAAIRALEGKHGTLRRLYDYRSNMMCKTGYLYIFEFNGETNGVRIECDDAFAAELKRRGRLIPGNEEPVYDPAEREK